MNVRIIKAGYRLTITTWEYSIDGDETAIIDGLTFNQAKLLTEICKIMSNGQQTKNMFGSMYKPTKKQIESFNNYVIDVYLRVFSSIPDWLTPPTYNKNLINDLLITTCNYDLYSLGLMGQVFYTRTCDKFVVEYFEQAVQFSDVTERFI